MIKHEAKASILFRHWIKANPQYSGTYEAKDSRGKNGLPFAEVKQQQLDYGMAAKSDKGVLIRILGSNGEPDYGYFRHASAWIVIKYQNALEIIDVETFIRERDRSKMKSLTASRAREISTISVPLKSKNRVKN